MRYRLLIAFTAPMFLCGCASLQDWLGQPGVTENLGALGKGALEVATNPLDFFAWWEIGAAVTALIAGPPAAVAMKRKVEKVVKEKVLNPEAPAMTISTDAKGQPDVV